MASAVENEFHPHLDQGFDLDSNQTLPGNYTDFEQFLCYHEHHESLVMISHDDGPIGQQLNLFSLSLLTFPDEFHRMLSDTR